MDVTVDPDFLTPPDDPTAVDPGDNSDNGPEFTPPEFSSAPGDASAPAAAAGDDVVDTSKRAPALPGSGDDMLALAQQRSASLSNGTAFGGAPTGPAANTATFSGDPSSGQTYGNPSATSPTASTYDAIFAAQNGPGSGSLSRPTTAADLANIPGLPGSGGIAPALGDPNHFNTRLGAESAPHASLPGAGGGGLPPEYANNAFDKAFYDKFGYFDNRFNSQQAMENNLLQGDQVIRPQAEYMAQFDPNLKAELGAVNGTPDFYNSQNAADWIMRHDQQIAQRIPAEFGNNFAAAQNLHNQALAPVANPIANDHALLAQNTRDALVQNLGALGAKDFKLGFDPYGNATLDYTAANGTPQQIKSDFVSLAGALDTLHQKVAAQAAAAPPAASSPAVAGPHVAPPRGGGGFPPRPSAPRFAPPRGGGGYAPPAAAVAPAAGPSVMPTGADVSNDIGSSTGYDTLAAQRLAAFDTMGPGGTRPNVPRSVASAVAYSPGIMPGGYSPYDQP